MNKSPEFDMLKELEEPGKERMRHLNHRKEKAPPVTDSERKSDMQSNPQTKLHPNPSPLVSSMENRADRGARVLTWGGVGGRPQWAGAPSPPRSSSQLGEGPRILVCSSSGAGQSPGLRPPFPPLRSRVGQGTTLGRTWAGPRHIFPHLEHTSWAAASNMLL